MRVQRSLGIKDHDCKSLMRSAQTTSAFGTNAPAISHPSRSFSACQGVHVGGGQGVAADSPIAAFHLLDYTPSDPAHALAFDRDHRVRELADDLALLLLAEDVPDDTNLDERHWIVLPVP